MEGGNTSRTANITFCSFQPGGQVSSVLLLCVVHTSTTAAHCQGSRGGVSREGSYLQVNRNTQQGKTRSVVVMKLSQMSLEHCKTQ